MIPERIAARLIPEPNTGCFLWEGHLDRKGYGEVWYQGRKRRLIRVVFKLTRGRWPRRDRVVLHACDTPACGNELHLREGTHRQNEHDKRAKGRGRGHFVAGGGRAP